MLDIRHAHDMM